MMSKPTTLAPPSMIAVITRPISPVQVTLGLPSKGAVRKVSSSSATTTAGEEEGARAAAKACQRSVVSTSIDRPRSQSNAGEAARTAAQNAITAPATAARKRAGRRPAGSMGGSV